MMVKKSNLWVFGILIVIAIIGYFVFSSGISGGKITGNTINNGDVQVVKMWVENGAYKFDKSVVVGKLVRIEADMNRMPGCSKAFMIPAFGVSKTFSTSNNALEFTPNKAGAFNVACSMNMYKGSLIVLESDGSKSNFKEAASASSGSCGAGGGCGGSGGCGCGG